MSALDKAFKNKISGVKKAIVDKTSDVLSAPARAYHGAKQKRADSDYRTLKRARAWDDAPSFDRHTGMPTDAFKARTMAGEVKSRYKK